MSTRWRRDVAQEVETVQLRLTKWDRRNLRRLMSLDRYAVRDRATYLNALLSRALSEECRACFEQDGSEVFPGRRPVGG
jgi:hypothetical protein